MAQNEATQPVNPFTPVFGKVPAYLAGRRQIIADMTAAFDQAGGNPDLCSIFVGARGAGKTALLTYLANEAESMGWIVANVTATPGMLEDILQQLHVAAAHLLESGSHRRLSSIEIAPIGSIAWDNQEEPPANWRTRMNVLFRQLEGQDVGIMLTVDEVDPDLDEMTQLVTTYQHFVRENKKAALLMAGLPHNVSALLSGKSTSFLRRASRHDLGSIPRYEVKDAFRLTVESGGRSIADNALDAAADAIDGFPYMFQLVGYRSWNAAGIHPSITLEHIQEGAQRAREELEDRVLTATYAELSPGDREFALAMAQDNGMTKQSDLTQRLGKSSGYVSSYKKRLIAAGVVEEPHRGMLRFALPGFREFVLREGA